MVTDAQALIDAGLAGGLSVEQLQAALNARLAQPPSQPTLAPPSAGDTAAPLEACREDDSGHAVSLPTTPAVPPDTPRIAGLSRYDDLGPIGKGGMGEVLLCTPVPWTPAGFYSGRAGDRW